MQLQLTRLDDQTPPQPVTVTTVVEDVDQYDLDDYVERNRVHDLLMIHARTVVTTSELSEEDLLVTLAVGDANYDKPFTDVAVPPRLAVWLRRTIAYLRSSLTGRLADDAGANYEGWDAA